MKCPLLGKKCIEKECAFWIKMTMKNPQSQEVDVREMCCIPEIPIIMVEMLKRLGGTQSATEQVRNRMEHVVHHGEVQNKIFAGLAAMSERKHLGGPT